MTPKDFYKLIDDSKRIVFFGGAGVSTASGIPDFRSAEGLYSEGANIPPEVILSNTFFWKHTEEFYRFYFDKMIYLDALPNYCHKSLKYLEDQNKLLGIITQNIDGLHQLAGSKNVIELHGSIYRYFSVKSKKNYTIDYVLAKKHLPFPVNEDNELIKPDVVLYEEPLNNQTIKEAIKLISQADLLIVGGTSLTVYPAASFINYFQGDKIVLINKIKLPRYFENEINEDINLVFKNYLNRFDYWINISMCGKINMKSRC